MVAYHASAKLRNKFIQRAKHHRAIGRCVQPGGTRPGRTAWFLAQRRIGMLSNASAARHYQVLERDAGLPAALCWIAEDLDAALPYGISADWPLRFVSAPRPGADLQSALHRFLAWLLGELPPCKEERYAGLVAMMDEIRSLHIAAGDGARIARRDWYDASLRMDATQSAMESDFDGSGAVVFAVFAAGSAAWSAYNSARLALERHTPDGVIHGALDAAMFSLWARRPVDMSDAESAEMDATVKVARPRLAAGMADKLEELMRAVPVAASAASGV